MGKNAALFGGNWDNAANSGSRASNWNNSPTNSNNNIGGRGVGEDENGGFAVSGLRQCCDMAGRPFFLWSAVLSCFGKHLWGSGRAPGSHHVVTNGAASFYHA